MCLFCHSVQDYCFVSTNNRLKGVLGFSQLIVEAGAREELSLGPQSPGEEEEDRGKREEHLLQGTFFFHHHFCDLFSSSPSWHRHPPSLPRSLWLLSVPMTICKLPASGAETRWRGVCMCRCVCVCVTVKRLLILQGQSSGSELITPWGCLQLTHHRLKQKQGKKREVSGDREDGEKETKQTYRMSLDKLFKIT